MTISQIGPDTEVIVSQMSFQPDAIDIAFMRLPDDTRAGNRLMATHTFSVFETHPKFADQVKEIRELATDLVVDLLNEFVTAPIGEVDDEEEEDEDEERGMGE